MKAVRTLLGSLLVLSACAHGPSKAEPVAAAPEEEENLIPEPAFCEPPKKGKYVLRIVRTYGGCELPAYLSLEFDGEEWFSLTQGDCQIAPTISEDKCEHTLLSKCPFSYQNNDGEDNSPYGTSIQVGHILGEGKYTYLKGEGSPLMSGEQQIVMLDANDEALCIGKFTVALVAMELFE